MQSGDLIATEHVHLAIHDLQTQWLEQAGGKAAPFEFLEVFIDAAHDPYVAGYRTHCRGLAVFKEIEPAATDPGFPWVVFRHGDGIHHIRAGNQSEPAACGHGLIPFRWTAFDEIAQGAHFDFQFGKLKQLTNVCLGSTPDSQVKLVRRQGRCDCGNDAAVFRFQFHAGPQHGCTGDVAVLFQ